MFWINVIDGTQFEQPNYYRVVLYEIYEKEIWYVWISDFVQLLPTLVGISELPGRLTSQLADAKVKANQLAGRQLQWSKQDPPSRYTDYASWTYYIQKEDQCQESLNHPQQTTTLLQQTGPLSHVLAESLSQR